MALKLVTAQIPGCFYRRQTPADPFFKQEGDTIHIGETIGLLELMKVYSPVTAAEAGKLIRFLVEDEAMVDAGDPLYEIEV